MTKEEWNQYKDLEYYPDRVCKCGCDGRIKVQRHHEWYGIPEYISGHQGGNKSSTLREIRICDRFDCSNTFECRMGSGRKHCSVSCASKGRAPWNKNLTKENDERVAKTIEKSTKTIRKQYVNGRKGSTTGMCLPPQTLESNAKRSQTIQKLYQNPEFLDRFHSAILKGENHPNYKDGSAISRYHPNFTESFRERIRSRDNHTCQLCGKIEEVSRQALSVHHIYYDGETNNCSDDNDFITLCVSCHIKTNYDREYWKEIFDG